SLGKRFAFVARKNRLPIFPDHAVYLKLLHPTARFMPDCGHMVSSQQKIRRKQMTTPLTFPGNHPFNRRTLMKGAASLAATAATMTAASAATVAPLGQTGAPTTATDPLPLGPLTGGRYPDSHLESAKKSSKPTFGPNGFPAFAGTMAVERVATGFRWAEGPAYFPAARFVLFSDIPNNRIIRFSKPDRHLPLHRHPPPTPTAHPT